MERKKQVKPILIGITIIFALLVGSPMFCVVYGTTREENIQKIEGFLNNEKVKDSLIQKGASPEKIIDSLNRLGDSQIEKLAEKANLQVGGAIEDKDTGADFWEFYKWYLITAMVLTIVLIVVAA